MAQTIATGVRKLDPAPAQYSVSWMNNLTGKLNNALNLLNGVNNQNVQKTGFFPLSASASLSSSVSTGDAVIYQNTGSLAVTISGNGVNIYDKGSSASTVSLAPNETISLFFDGSTWRVTSRY